MKKNVIWPAIWILMYCYGSSMAQQKAAPSLWYKNYETALDQARATGRPLLIRFSGSDWCRSCIKLDKEVFSSSDFEGYAAAHLVLLELDFPRMSKNRLSKAQKKHNENLAAKYNPEGAFPLIVLLDSTERIIARTGYREGGAQHFIDFLSTTDRP